MRYRICSVQLVEREGIIGNKGRGLMAVKGREGGRIQEVHEFCHLGGVLDCKVRVES